MIIIGRIRTHFIKGLAEQIVATHPGKFGADYDANKKMLAELKVVDGKFTRNKVAGYICCVVRRKKY